MTEFLTLLRDWVWGIPFLCFIAGTGLYLTFRLGGLQFAHLGTAFRMIGKSRSNEGGDGEISGFQALMTSLAGAVGTGSIAGVATAVTIGGFGSIFWMWVTAFLAMAVSYTEAFLGVKYRMHRADGHVVGGPMYTLERGVGSRTLALCFAVAGAIAAFGIGSLVQSHSVADALYTGYGIAPEWTGLFMLSATALVVAGGVKSIGRVTGVLVPVMGVIYIATSLLVLAFYADRIPAAFLTIFREAFSAPAAMGGAAGSGILIAIRHGMARGIFCNESGMGSGSIAAASARTGHPAQQALLQMMGVFISTVLICTVSALVLGVSGVVGIDGIDGASMAMMAFGSVSPLLRHVLSIGLFLFAYSTILAWAYYGEACIEYVAGERSVWAYRILYISAAFFAVWMPIRAVWAFADIANALMAIPNLIGVLALTRVVVSETRSFLDLTAHRAAN